MGNFTVAFGRDANEKILAKALSIDKIVYPEVYHTIIENATMWYKKNNDTFIFIFEDNEVIGYLSLLPISDSLYKDILSGTVEQDIYINTKDIHIYEPNKTYNCYLFSIVLHPDHQGSDALKTLLKGFFEYLILLKSEGIIFDKILADAVSNGGDKTALNLGLTKVRDSNHDSYIYESTIDNMIALYRSGTLANYPLKRTL